jgi:hypothetical protein
MCCTAAIAECRIVGGKAQQQPGAAAEQVGFCHLFTRCTLRCTAAASERSRGGTVMQGSSFNAGISRPAADMQSTDVREHSLYCCVLLQVSLLVLHEPFSPATPRLLRQAAELLCPQSVAVGAPLLAEHITPITTGSGFEGAEDAAVKPVFASILHLANAGERRKDALQLVASCMFVKNAINFAPIRLINS